MYESTRNSRATESIKKGASGHRGINLEMWKPETQLGKKKNKNETKSDVEYSQEGKGFTERHKVEGDKSE